MDRLLCATHANRSHKVGINLHGEIHERVLLDWRETKIYEVVAHSTLQMWIYGSFTKPRRSRMDDQ